MRNRNLVILLALLCAVALTPVLVIAPFEQIWGAQVCAINNGTVGVLDDCDYTFFPDVISYEVDSAVTAGTAQDTLAYMVPTDNTCNSGQQNENTLPSTNVTFSDITGETNSTSLPQLLTSDDIRYQAVGDAADDGMLRCNFTIPASNRIHWATVEVEIGKSSTNDNKRIALWDNTGTPAYDAVVLGATTTADTLYRFNISGSNITNYMGNKKNDSIVVLGYAAGSANGRRIFFDLVNVTVSYNVPGVDTYDVSLNLTTNPITNSTYPLNNLTVVTRFQFNITDGTKNWYNDVYNFNTNTWNQINSGTLSTSFTTSTITKALSDTPSNFINSTSNTVKTRIRTDTGVTSAFKLQVDFVNLTVNFNDTTSPNFTANFTSVATGVQYAPGRDYGFQSNWTEVLSDVDDVLFESNFNSSLRNFSVSLEAGTTKDGRYVINFTDLAGGTYRYRWIANDTAGNVNSTSVITYAIAQNTSGSITLMLNGLQSNRSYTTGSSANFTANFSAGSVEPINMTSNYTGFSQQNGTNIIYNTTTVSLIGDFYNLTAFSNGTVNYTRKVATLFFNVTDVLSQTYEQQINETISTTDGGNKNNQLGESQSTSILISDDNLKGVGKGASESISLENPSQLGLTKVFADLLSSTNVNQFGIFKSLADVLSIAQIGESRITFLRAISESASLSELTSSLKVLQISSAELLSMSEITSSFRGVEAVVSDVLRLTDASSISLVLQKTISQLLQASDISSANAAIQKLVSDTFSLTEASDSVKGFQKFLSETLTLRDASNVSLILQRFLSDSLSTNEIGNVNKFIYESVTDLLQLQNDSFLNKFFENSLSETLSSSQTTVRGITLQVVDALNATEIFSTVQAIHRSLSEAMSTNVISSISRFVGTFVTDTLGISEISSDIENFQSLVSQTVRLADASSLSQILQRFISDTISANELSSLNRSFFESVSDALSITEFTATVNNLQRFLFESIRVVDLPLTNLSLQRIVSDIVGTSDVTDVMKQLQTSLAETLGLTDISAVSKLFTTFVTDTLGLNEFLASVRNFQPLVIQAFDITDESSLLQSLQRFMQQQMSLGDLGSASRNIILQITDMLTTTDSTNFVKGLQNFLSESIDLSDLSSINIVLQRSVSESAVIQDLTGMMRLFQASLSETLNVADISSLSKVFQSYISEVLSLADARNINLMFIRAFSEANVLDSASRINIAVTQYLSDLVGVGDLSGALRSLERSISEGITFQETNLFSYSFQRVLSEAIRLAEVNNISKAISVRVDLLMSLIESMISQFVEFVEEIVEQITTPSTGGGGGGGGGGSTTSETVTISAPAGTTIAEFGSEAGHAISEIEVDLQNAASNLQLSVQRLFSKPGSVTQAPGTVYTYLDISAAGTESSNIKGAKITFVVAGAWLNQNEIDAGTIALNRYSDGQWSKLQTRLVSSGAASYTFEAESPGFSTFAITGDKLVGISGPAGALAGDLGITNLPVIIGAAAGGTAITEIEVKNLNSGDIADVKLRLSGLPDSWYAVAPSVQTVPIGETRKFIVAFSVPADADASDYKVNAYVESPVETDSFSFFLRVSPTADELKRPVVTRTINFETERGKTGVTINVINPSRQFEEVRVTENVDKSLANNTDYIDFRVGTPEIIQKDPVFLYSFDQIKGGEVRNALYALPELVFDLSSLVYWPFEQVTFFDQTFPESFKAAEPSSAIMVRNFDNGFDVLVENTDDSNHTLEISLELPHGWTSRPASITHEMAPHESRKFHFDVKVPLDDEGGQRIMTVVYRWDDSIIARDLVVTVFRLTNVILVFTLVPAGLVVAYLVLRNRRKYGAPRYNRLQAMRDSLSRGGTNVSVWQRPHTVAYSKLAAVKDSLERARRIRRGR